MFQGQDTFHDTGNTAGWLGVSQVRFDLRMGISMVLQLVEPGAAVRNLQIL